MNKMPEDPHKLGSFTAHSYFFLKFEPQVLLIIMGVIPICLSVLLTNPALCKVAVDPEFSLVSITRKGK